MSPLTHLRMLFRATQLWISLIPCKYRNSEATVNNNINLESSDFDLIQRNFMCWKLRTSPVSGIVEPNLEPETSAKSIHPQLLENTHLHLLLGNFRLYLPFAKSLRVLSESASLTDRNQGDHDVIHIWFKHIVKSKFEGSHTSPIITTYHISLKNVVFFLSRVKPFLSFLHCNSNQQHLPLLLILLPWEREFQIPNESLTKRVREKVVFAKILKCHLWWNKT